MNEFPADLQTRMGAAGAGEAVLSVLLGMGFTMGLFLGIAHLQNITPAAAPLDLDDLRTVALPLEPPPPQVVPPEVEPVVTTVTGFDATPSDSPVKITVTPPELADLLPPPPAAPPAVIQVGLLYANFKPKMDFSGAAERIFQTSEVDQVPRVLYTVMPAVSQRLLGSEGAAHVTVMLIIDTNGAAVSATLAQSSGNPELDAIMIQNIKEWAFSPAIKKGRKVRCLIQQRYNIMLSTATGFHIN